MSPWLMMNEWGIPTFYLEALTYQFASKLTGKGLRVPDLAIAGGFSEEASVFKAIATGAPYVKAVCMGRALLIPGMVGKNIAQWIKDNDLPRTVSKYGNTPEQIFVTYDILKSKYGNEIENMPLGAIGLYTFCEKIKTGLQQLMAGSRNFSLHTVSRKDVMALTEEAAKISGIPYVMDAYREEADRILG
jgi:glutamate synthase domain-containing protein 2